MTHINKLTHEILGGAIEVHRKLGPGLLESAYRKCLCRDLLLRGVHLNERAFTVGIQGIRLECGYRVVILVGGIVRGGNEIGEPCAHS